MNRNKVKICCIIPSLQAGGMERVMSELVSHFSTYENVEVTLILYGIERGVFYQIPGNVILIKPSFNFHNYPRFLSTLKTLIFIRKQIKQINPDSILSFGEYWNSFVLLALYGLKFPIFISDRCKPDKSYGRLHSILRKWLYPRATGIIAQTHKAKEIYFKYFNHLNIKIIANPIRQILNPNKTQREDIILTVGRLINTKHHDELIKIFADISFSDWKLIIVGGDSLKQNNFKKLKELIIDLNLEERIILTGEISNVDEYYCKSKIFAFTSSSEGFPNVIGEAMSAELPVVAYDCVAGPSEMIIDGENGYLVDLFDAKTFSKNLLRLMSDEDFRTKMGKNARKDIERFSINIIAREYFSFIHNQV